jgi:RHS repeat-associated protein
MYTIRPHAPIDIGGVGYTYDTNGNQTGFISPNVTRVIQWDEDNRIKSVSDNGSTSDYVYDHTGERVIKRSSQGETAYVNQFYSVRNGSIITKHVFVGTDRIATRVHTSRNNDLYFYHTDHLGSTNVLTDGYGEIYEHLEFFAFGETWVGERATSNSTPYLFTSKELDETGLYYIHARYFDPRTSVWQSVDPAFGRGEYFPTMPTEEEELAEFQQNPFGYWQDKLPGMGGVFNALNLGVYSYSHQNPVKLSDPDGNNPIIYRLLTHPATQRAYQYAERLLRGAYIAVTNTSYSVGRILSATLGSGTGNVVGGGANTPYVRTFPLQVGEKLYEIGGIEIPSIIRSGNQTFRILPSAIKHLKEFAGRSQTFTGPLNNKLFGESYMKALTKALDSGVKIGEKMKVDNWEFLFVEAKDGGAPLLIHAQPIKALLE